MASSDTERRLRRLLLALLTLALLGTGTELLLLGHYEDPWQIVPLLLVVVSLVAIAAHAISAGPGTVLALRGAMSLLVVAGAMGVVLHYRGNLEFQLDMDPTASQWQLFKKVIRAKAPPALAPGALAQFGLLGWVLTYRDPALRRHGRSNTGASL